MFRINTYNGHMFATGKTYESYQEAYDACVEHAKRVGKSAVHVYEITTINGKLVDTVRLDKAGRKTANKFSKVRFLQRMVMNNIESLGEITADELWEAANGAGLFVTKQCVRRLLLDLQRNKKLKRKITRTGKCIYFK